MLFSLKTNFFFSTQLESLTAYPAPPEPLFLPRFDKYILILKDSSMDLYILDAVQLFPKLDPTSEPAQTSSSTTNQLPNSSLRRSSRAILPLEWHEFSHQSPHTTLTQCSCSFMSAAVKHDCWQNAMKEIQALKGNRPWDNIPRLGNATTIGCK